LSNETIIDRRRKAEAQTQTKRHIAQLFKHDEPQQIESDEVLELIRTGHPATVAAASAAVAARSVSRSPPAAAAAAAFVSKSAVASQ